MPEPIRLRLQEVNSEPELAGTDNAEQTPGQIGAERKAPPSLAAFYKYPIIAAVGVGAIITTVANWTGWDCDPLLMDARAWDGQLWRLPGSALPHVGLMHLAFNLYWLWVLGTAVEGPLGWLATSVIVLILAAGSAAAQYALSVPGVGLSGLVYGLFGMLLVLGRRDHRFARVIDGRIAAMFVGWFVLCWIMTEAGAWKIANVAHGAGAILGLLLGWTWIARGRRRVLAATALIAATVLSLIGAAIRTPSAAELAYLGYFDLVSGRIERAADRYQRAVEKDPGQADWWHNLGTAQEQLEQNEAAVRSFRKEVALRPSNKEAREALAYVLMSAGYDRQVNGDVVGAIALYRELLEINDGLAAIWYDLGLAYLQQEQKDAARAALRRAIQLEPSNPNYRAALESVPE